MEGTRVLGIGLAVLGVGLCVLAAGVVGVGLMLRVAPQGAVTVPTPTAVVVTPTAAPAPSPPPVAAPPVAPVPAEAPAAAPTPPPVVAVPPPVATPPAPEPVAPVAPVAPGKPMRPELGFSLSDTTIGQGGITIGSSSIGLMDHTPRVTGLAAAASANGVRTGDHIYMVDGHSISTVADFDREMAKKTIPGEVVFKMGPTAGEVRDVKFVFK